MMMRSQLQTKPIPKPQGLSREEWLNDFHCPSEAFELEIIAIF
jgi:hypothetical protein